MIPLNADGSDYKHETEDREIFKDPITDDGTKKSLKGRILVTKDNEKGLVAIDQIKTWNQCDNGELQTVFKDGKLIKTTTLEEIRERLMKTMKEGPKPTMTEDMEVINDSLGG